jgi:hypothetical protein
VVAPGIAEQAELEPRGGGGEGGEGANVDPQGAVPPLHLVHGRGQVAMVLKLKTVENRNKLTQGRLDYN